MSFQNGDVAAFDTLVDRYTRPLFAFVLRQVRERTLAEDLCQETFLRVYERAGRYQASGRFKSWFFTIARNLCLHQLRRRRFVADVADPDGDQSEAIERAAAASRPVVSPGDVAERGEIARVLDEAIRALPAEQREVLLLKEQAGLTCEEIGRMLAIPTGTAKSRLHYALRSLRSHLASRDITKETVLE